MNLASQYQKLEKTDKNVDNNTVIV
jgi:hypothetical protein